MYDSPEDTPTGSEEEQTPPAQPQRIQTPPEKPKEPLVAPWSRRGRGEDDGRIDVV